MAVGGLRLDRSVAPPKTQSRQGYDDGADHQARVAVGDRPQGEVAEHDSGGREGEELPQIAPLSVPAIREHGDKISEYQQRQDDAARLFAARKNMCEQRHGQDAETGDAALRHADHKGAECGEYPLQGFEGHVSFRGWRRSGKLESQCPIFTKIPRNRRCRYLRWMATAARTWSSWAADSPDCRRPCRSRKKARASSYWRPMSRGGAPRAATEARSIRGSNMSLMPW